MPHYPAGKVDDVEISVNDWGEWVATVGGVGLREDTRDALEKKIKAQKKLMRVPVEVLFTMSKGSYNGRAELQDGWATGLHATTGKALLRFTTGERSQEKEGWGPNAPTYYRRLDEAQKAQLLKIHDDLVRAKLALQHFDQEFGIGAIRNAVQTAIQAKQATEAKEKTDADE